MTKKNKRYEKPILENMDVVAEGQSGSCNTNGSVAFDNCGPGGVPTLACSTGGTK